MKIIQKNDHYVNHNGSIGSESNDDVSTIVTALTTHTSKSRASVASKKLSESKR